MAKSSSKWLTGCGIGCGAVLLIIIIVLTIGYFSVRGTIQTFRSAEESSEILTDTYGGPEEYTPSADGSVAPDRILAFLAVQDTLTSSSSGIVSSFHDLEDNVSTLEEGDESFMNVMKLVGKGIGILPQIAAYIDTRNRVLLSQEMGIGEYYYLYSVSYYGWLGHSPEDGPAFPLRGTEGNEDFNPDDEEQVRRQRRERIVDQVRDLVIPMMERQYETAVETGAGTAGWRSALKSELDALRDRYTRYPYQNGVPRVIAYSLEPYRTELEHSYSATLNPVVFTGESW